MQSFKVLFIVSFLTLTCYAIEDNSTTISPNTTTPAVVTTTSLPPTTPPPAPTPAPTPIPTTAPPAPPTTVAPPSVPQLVKFNVTDGNLTCIEAEFAVQFKNLWNASVVVTEAAIDEKKSHCGNETEALAFTFVADKKSYSAKLTFQKSGDERFLSLIEVTRGTETVAINQTAFKLSGDKLYSCNHSTEVTGNNVTAVFDRVKISVFRTETSGNEVYVCVSDDTVNDMVPIAVGCALLALVVIVLIAYFIGRRRSRRLAYQSV